MREDIVRINAEIRPEEWSRWLKKDWMLFLIRIKFYFKKMLFHPF